MKQLKHAYYAYVWYNQGAITDRVNRKVFINVAFSILYNKILREK
jgi:hypothetical protein